MLSLETQLRNFGYFVVRGLLTSAESSHLVNEMQQLAGGRKRWTCADGVNQHPQFWHLIDHPRILGVMRQVFGPDVKYLPHNDLHLGFSSFSWHRDSVHRDSAKTSASESDEPYRLVRVGLYLQPFETSQFKLGLVPGSHRPTSRWPVEQQRRIRRRTGGVANVISGLSGLDLIGNDAEWIGTDPGDCIVFDPRVLHTGSRFHGQKHAVFLAYGINNSHFQTHWHYYRHLRPDLGYRPMAPALQRQLQQADLLAPEPQQDLPVEGAWIPSSAFTTIARRFK